MGFYRVTLNDLKTHIFTGNSIYLIQQIFLQFLQEGPVPAQRSECDTGLGRKENAQNQLIVVVSEMDPWGGSCCCRFPETHMAVS